MSKVSRKRPHRPNGGPSSLEGRHRSSGIRCNFVVLAGSMTLFVVLAFLGLVLRLDTSVPQSSQNPRRLIPITRRGPNQEIVVPTNDLKDGMERKVYRIQNGRKELIGIVKKGSNLEVNHTPTVPIKVIESDPMMIMMKHHDDPPALSPPPLVPVDQNVKHYRTRNSESTCVVQPTCNRGSSSSSSSKILHRMPLPSGGYFHVPLQQQHPIVS